MDDSEQRATPPAENPTVAAWRNAFFLGYLVFTVGAIIWVGASIIVAHVTDDHVEQSYIEQSGVQP